MLACLYVLLLMNVLLKGMVTGKRFSILSSSTFGISAKFIVRFINLGKLTLLVYAKSSAKHQFWGL